MRQLGKIHCEEINHDDNAPWVIFFHGYGADNKDLFSLGQVIQTKKTLNWLFPNGPLEVPIGPGWTGRAWWNIDMMEVQRAMESGTHRDFTNETPKGLDKAFEKTMEMIKQLRVPWNQIIPHRPRLRYQVPSSYRAGNRPNEQAKAKADAGTESPWC